MHEVDLHLHTTHSDGALTPAQVVDLCVSRRLKAMAISDHDSVEGVAEAISAASGRGIEVIAAVELSADAQGDEAHVLGYYVDTEDAAFQALLLDLRAGRAERGRAMVSRLRAIGVDVDWERVREIAGEGAVGRPHIAQAMVERGHVADTQEAFDRYIGRGGPAYAGRALMSPTEAARALVDNGALPVLAHPLYFEREDMTRLSAFCAELKEAGMVGLEAHHGDFTPDETAKLLDICEKLDLIPCGGSDYHATGRPGEKGPGDAGPPMSSLERLKALRRSSRRR